MTCTSHTAGPRLLSVWMFCAALVLSVPSKAETILVLKSRDTPQYSEAVTGFIQEWAAHGSGADIQTRLLADWTNDVTRTPVGTNALAIVAVGTDATRWAITNATVPVVFCMVANVRQSVMADLSPADEAKVCGVSLNIPAEAQLAVLKTYLVSAKRVGVIYDPQKSAAMVQDLENAAAKMGLELVREAVTSESSVPEAAGRIASRIDALWAPVDSTVFNSRGAQFILTQMLQRKVPVMGFSENMVRAGALLGLRVTYTDAGRQAATMLQTMVQTGRPAQPRIQTPQSYQVLINGRVLELLGTTIPSAAIRQAIIINNEE
jgi:putative tryptophan/tyrosine transport system substrate-binding protein